MLVFNTVILYHYTINNGYTWYNICSTCFLDIEYQLVIFAVWFVEQPKQKTIVVTGNKLKLSCRAEATPGVKVDYVWFKCSKKDGTHKTPIDHVDNNIIIPVCNDTNDGHYMCEAFATMTTNRDSINSRVARVKVVNSTNISITKEPPDEVFITVGETLYLECEASCKTHSVKYQWYNETEPVDGATQSVLKIPAISEIDIGSYYYCEVTSEYSATKAKSKLTHVRSM